MTKLSSAFDQLFAELNDHRALATHTELTEYRLETLEDFFSVYATKTDTEKAMIQNIINRKSATNIHIRATFDKSANMKATSTKNIAELGTRTFVKVFESKDLQGMCNTVWKNKVENNQKREGNESGYAVSERAWGRVVTKGIVVHIEKNEIYLSMNPTQTNNVCFSDENGGYVEFSEYDRWLQNSKRPEYIKAKAQEKQGVANPERFINIKISSIEKLYHSQMIFDTEKETVTQR